MPAAWRFAAASVRGTSHAKSGTPCQDHAEVAAVPAIGTQKALIAVASDGAGSAARSDEGARAACRAFLEFGRLGLEWLGGQPEFLQDGFEARLLEDLKRELQELAAEAGEQVQAFACTVLGALVVENSALFVQLGDGAIAYRVEGSEAWRIAVA